MMDLISVQDLNVRFGRNTILHNVSMKIERGEIVTIVGPNGSGKSTLLRTIIGALRPDSGAVNVSAGTKIGYVPQKLMIDATLPMTVRRFLSLPTRHSDAQANQALHDAGVHDLQSRQMTDLSGGQFQRVLLARALLEEPDVLILDEATQGLDQAGSAAFYQRIEQVRERTGCAILMVSHELHVVMRASDRVICLNGHVCCHGTPEIVASAPEYRALFGNDIHGTLALYRHEHDHHHDHSADCGHGHANDKTHDHKDHANVG